MDVYKPGAGGEGPGPPSGYPAACGAGEEAGGWFPADSMIRRIGREALTLLGGGRAILLQIAHPLVAAGVADHSDYRTDPLGRLFRTLELMHTLVYGSRSEAEQGLRRFHAVHARIQGSLERGAGLFPAGASYTARDPELKLWVHATLVESGLIAYDRFVAPLTTEERRRYYADMRVLARMLGIPDRVLPATLEDFHLYMDGMLAGDTLAVTPETRRLAWSVLHPSVVGIGPSASARLFRLVTVGLLPERFRKAYGLEWGPGRQRRLDRLSRTTRLFRPWMPAWVWQGPLHGHGLARLLVWGSGISGGRTPRGPGHRPGALHSRRQGAN